jgi:transposase
LQGQETFRLSVREMDRLKILHEVLTGKLNKTQAAKRLGLSRRQVIRIYKRIKRKGDRAIIHGLRGKPSNRKLDSELICQAKAWIESQLKDFGPTFVQEKLQEEHGIKLSITVTRRIMIEEGFWKPHKRKPKHRYCRERKECFGEMVQLDGSHHDWFSGRAPKCVLLLFIDDATSRILHGEFVPTEDTFHLMRATTIYLKAWGRPVTFYVDRDSIFKTTREPSIEEQLKDAQPLTQFARAMEELNIKLIFAYSPQAKGRVERSFRTHQDRLVNELTLRGICTIEKANVFLWTKYIPAHNKKFAVPAANPADAHRPLLADQQLTGIFSFQTQRTLLNDFTLRFNNFYYQILPTEGVLLKPKDKITVELRLDHTLHLRLKNRYLKFKEVPKPKQDIPVEIIAKPRKSSTPPKDAPWRKFQLWKDFWRERKLRRSGTSL